MLYRHYLEKMNYLIMPTYIIKYLNTPSLIRLKKIGYFCGMDYASKDIYKFEEKISRFDHSLSTALIINKLTNDRVKTLAGLFHDVSTPCFSHAIDYMNQDYERQERTEEFTEYIIKNDVKLNSCFKQDDINIDDIINFKKYSIVDTERPKICADRIDGIILTGISWTKNIDQNDIDDITNDMYLANNEFNEEEICFNNINIAKKVLEVNDSIDLYCHSKEDNYMMHLLATITSLAIHKGYIKYEDLYFYNEDEIINLFESIDDKKFKKYVFDFKNMKLTNIPDTEIPKIKKRTLNPLIKGKRYY